MPAVIKPATLTPLATFFAVDLARRAGVPDELVRVVTTTNASAFSEAILTDARVRKVSFTGSTGVGKVLLRLAADNVLRSSMELGGDAPLIVFDDADLERAVNGAFAAKMRNGVSRVSPRTASSSRKVSQTHLSRSGRNSRPHASAMASPTTSTSAR